MTERIVTDVGPDRQGDAKELARDHAARVAADAAAPTEDPKTLALLRNDLRGLSKETIGELVAELTRRMGVDPALAPIDLIPDRGGALRLYINARGAAELAKRHDLSDDDLTVDIRDAVVIVRLSMVSPETGRRRTDIGAAAYDAARPDTLARGVKAASTSAHRRVTLGMVGVFLNEPESWATVGGAPDV